MHLKCSKCRILEPCVVVEVEVKQSHYRPGDGPEGSRRLRFPDFKTVGT